MIVLHSFTEAVQQHIPHRLLQDQAGVLIGLCQQFHVGVSDSLEITQADIGWLAAQPEANDAYLDFLGGNVHICQTPEDLLEVQGLDSEWAESHGGQWPNVTEAIMSWDQCDYLTEVGGDPQWAIFLLCTNNAGGHVYYIPKSLWTLARVEEHIALTNDYWRVG